MNKQEDIESLIKLCKNQWPTTSIAAIMSFLMSVLNIPGTTAEALAQEIKQNPAKIRELVPEVGHDYMFQSPGNPAKDASPSLPSGDPKLGELDPVFSAKVNKVLQRLKSIKDKKGIAMWQPVIAEAMRTQHQQNQKVEQGFSTKKDSKHLYGLAADIVDKRWFWGGEAKDLNHPFWQALGQAAKAEGLQWGGDWKSFKDVAHIQMPADVAPTAAFNAAVATTLEFEKGYQNKDHETNMGITIHTYSKWLKKQGLPTDKIDMRNIPKNHVMAIYKTEYWDAIQGDKIPPSVSMQLFDYAVNSGVPQAVKTLQRIVGASADGRMGPKTRQLTQDYVKKHGEADLAKRIFDTRNVFIASLLKKDKYKANTGWLDRMKKMEQLLPPRPKAKPKSMKMREKNPPPSLPQTFETPQADMFHGKNKWQYDY